MANATITHTSLSGTKRILCNMVTIAGKINLVSTPNANAGSLVEVQKQSYENLIYNVQGVKFTGAADTLTYNDLLTIYRATYDGTNPAILAVTYGTNKLVNVNSQDTGVSVILKNFSFPVSARDSKDAYMPVGNMVFVETLG